MRRAMLLIVLGFLGALACANAQAPPANLGGSFELTDHNGKPFSSATLAGRPYAIFFGFTNCPDVCPTTLLLMSNALARLGADADRLKVLFVTVDPEQDTPEQLRKYMSSFDARILALTGTPGADRRDHQAVEGLLQQAARGQGRLHHRPLGLRLPDGSRQPSRRHVGLPGRGGRAGREDQEALEIARRRRAAVNPRIAARARACASHCAPRARHWRPARCASRARSPPRAAPAGCRRNRPGKSR